MKLRLWLSPTAKAQTVKEDVWWQKNRRAAPDAFWKELMAALETLRSFPDSGARVRRAGVADSMRRIPLQTSGYHVYYVHDEDRAQVRVYAVWSAERAKGPALPKRRTPRRRR